MEAEGILLQTAVRAARAAGGVLLEKLSVEREVQIKGLRDIVTDADLAAEESSNSKCRPRIGGSSFLLGWQIKIGAS